MEQEKAVARLAEPESRVRKTIVHKYEIPSPASDAEIAEALNAAEDEMIEKDFNYNERRQSVWIVGNEHTVTVYWEEV
jgi:hypothetical protein